jgi:c-di-GMP-binding flagellar brake protein YcgR
MSEERRRYPRADVKYRINVICTGEVIKGQPQNYIFHTYTENISEGGTRLVLEKEIKPGSLVSLELFVSDKESLPVKCNGVVIWSKKANPESTKPDLFHMGIQFTDLKNPIYLKLVRDVINFYLGNKTE